VTVLVRPIDRVPRRRARDPDERDISVLLDLTGWYDDAERLVRALPATVEIVAVDRSPDPDLEAGWLAGHDGDATVLIATPATGYGRARSEALWRAHGGICVIADTSVEPAGDLLGVLSDALADPSVAVAGPFGLVTPDLREYEERTEGDVTAVQGYALAARRGDLAAIDGVRESFVFYRNADIDLSLRLRAASSPPRRAVAVGAHCCVRHGHREWDAVPAAERDALSRRNMARVLAKFGDRRDLAVGG
jgi:hypothetical protein